MMSYMIVSSGPLLIISMAMIPFAMVYAIFDLVKKAGLSLFGKAIEVRELAGILSQMAVAFVAEKVLMKDFVEEYSYRQAC